MVSGSDIDITNANSLTYRIFAVSPSSTDIGQVTINASSNSTQPSLLIGRFTFLTEPTASQRLDAAGGRHLEGVTSNIGRVRLQLWVNGDVTEEIDVHEIVRADVDGDVLDSVSHRPVSGLTPSLGLFRVLGNVDPATGGIVAFAGSIAEVRVFGDLTCDVIAIAGKIAKVDVDGDIGTSTDPVEITAGGTTDATNDIDLVAGDNVYADISAPDWITEINADGEFGSAIAPPGHASTSSQTLVYLVADSINADVFVDPSGSLGRIRRIETRSGAFKGALSFRESADNFGTTYPAAGLYVAGDLDADLTVTKRWSRPMVIDGKLKSGRTINIARDLGDGTCDGTNTTGARIEIKTALGLEGQIIVNSLMDTVFPARWEGPVKIGPSGGGQIVLQPACGSSQEENRENSWYAETSAQLGGGAIGFAEFNFHAEDCVPAHDGTMSPPDDEAIDRHYGPVFIQGTDMPVIVERQRLHPPSSVWALVTSQHTASVSGTNPRDLIVQPNTGDFISNYKYRVTPISGRLKCSNVTGSPDVVYYQYIFNVPLDTSGDGFLSEDDIDAWIVKPQDLNIDDLVDAADLAVILDALASDGGP